MPGMRTDPNKSPDDFWLSRKLREYTSLDTPTDESLGDSAAQFAGGFVPGISQAMALRDIERARRDQDYTGMALSGLSLIPGAHLIKGLRKGGNAARELIAGRNARHAPHSALDHAESMHKAGKTAQEQWDETGKLFGEKNRSFVGAEGKPMWEIDDAPARIKGDPEFGSFPYQMREKVHHPELYANYPEMGETWVNGGVNKNLKPGYSTGEFVPPRTLGDKGRITAEASDTPELTSTLLHELQHGVQVKEGFEGGTSQNGLRAWLGDKYLDKTNKLASEVEGKALDVMAQKAYETRGGERIARVVEGTWGTPEGVHPQALAQELRKTVPIRRADPWGTSPDDAWYGGAPPLPSWLK